MVAVSETSEPDVVVDVTKTAQTIDGFGTCFNELGWTSLSLLDETVRESILKEMFAPGVGANFTICRMPVAANDFAIDWYSYNETEGDFEEFLDRSRPGYLDPIHSRCPALQSEHQDLGLTLVSSLVDEVE